MTARLKNILYKACRRCRGDLVLEDQKGSIEYPCIQCGGRTPLRALGPSEAARPEAA